jgi:hypothetical protein
MALGTDLGADYILTDVNTAIEQTWSGSRYDLRALPNHILLPYAQFNRIATTKVSSGGNVSSILQFLLENNLAKQNGGELFIGATPWNDGAGAGSTDRMCVYTHDDYFLAIEELVPLTRTLTNPDVNEMAYLSAYQANVSEVEIFYPQTITYWDGI